MNGSSNVAICRFVSVTGGKALIITEIPMPRRFRKITSAAMTIAFAIGNAIVAAPASAAPAPADEVALVRAAKSGDSEMVAKLLRERVDVNARAADGMTALHWAAYGGDLELARRLIASGADVNLANRYGVPPLVTACARAHATLVSTLLEAGADANAAPVGEPVIMTAARTGSVDAVTALLARGANVNATETSKGQTPLMWAAAENHESVVRVLLSKGADVRARSTTGFTALMLAARQGHLGAAKVLVESGADVNDRTPDGTPLLTLAVENLRYATAEFLLERGADPKAVTKREESVLHVLVRGRAPTRRRRPVDDLASATLLEHLLAKGAHANARTPKAPKITDAMVASSLRPAIDNVVNLGGATPFLLAAQAADLKAMRILLDHGADPTLATYENTTTLMMAAGVGFVEGRERTRPERDALAAVKLLAESGVDINAVNERGQTAVHGAVYRAADSIIEFLAQARARLDVRDELGRTPQQLAESGFNQVSSVIRRERSAALLRRLSADATTAAR